MNYKEAIDSSERSQLALSLSPDETRSLLSLYNLRLATAVVNQRPGLRFNLCATSKLRTGFDDSGPDVLNSLQRAA
jgi:hypothetical protein